MTREFPRAPILAVSCAVTRGDAVLLVRRGREPAKGRWGLPGGAVEAGETLLEAVRREVREETGIAIGEPRFLHHHEVIERAGGRVRFHYLIAVHAAEAVGAAEPAAGDDADEARFVTAGEQAALDITDGTLRTLRLLRRNASNAAPGSAVTHP